MSRVPPARARSDGQDRPRRACAACASRAGAQARHACSAPPARSAPSTLDLIGRNPHLFEVVALTANSNVDALAELALRHRAALAVVADESRYGALKERLAGTRHRGRGGRRGA